MAAESVALQIGDEAPPVDLLATGGVRFSLNEERGRWVVLYFYPRANTPG